MSSWRTKVRLPATFRGVAFWVEGSEFVSGRRTVQHVYPFKDLPFSEDMGLRPRSFPLEGFVVGNAYIEQRDKLIAALEVKGPGELVHPFHGTKRVACASFRVRESAGEGGVARFSIEFEETPAKAIQPSTVKDAAGTLKASANAARTACGVEFLATYSPGTLLDSVTGQLRKASTAMTGMLSKIKMETQAVARLQRSINDLSTNAVSFANEPTDLLATQIEIFESLADGLVATATALNPLAPINAFLDLYEFDTGTRPPALTVNRALEQANFDASQRLTQRLVTIQACLIAVEQTFPSYDDAVTARALVTDLLDDQADLATDDIYPTLLQLRADLVNAVPGDALELPRLVAHTPPATIPSLVLVHTLYGNLDLEADVIARNRIRHPAFVKGGSALEILTRG